uniref:Uncharacterized protein n=1 Tax=Avena sativa TaxID=4498 RepID=A0ACD5VQ36_AVESA
MAITSLQLPSPIPGLPPRIGCTSRRTRLFTVSCKHNQSSDVEGASLTSRTSRRGTLAYISSAFLATFLVVDPADARTSRQENKRIVMEKLEKIREKALAPKAKVKNEDTVEKESVANLLIPPALVDAYI